MYGGLSRDNLQTIYETHSTSTKCHRSGTIYHPTETRYIFVQILIFPTLKCEQPRRCKHVCVTCLFLLWLSSPSVCLRYAISHKTVADEDKQYGYETFIVLALMNNNNCAHVTVRDLHLLHGCPHHCHGNCAVHPEDLAAVKVK